MDLSTWQLNATSRYNVASVYNFLTSREQIFNNDHTSIITSREQIFNNDHTSIIWHKEVPLKVNILKRTLIIYFCIPFLNIFFNSIAGWFLKKSLIIFFYLIWLSCIWIVWCDKNSSVFQQKGNSIHQLIDKIKLQFFYWLKENHLNFVFNYHTWWLNPLLCFGVAT